MKKHLQRFTQGTSLQIFNQFGQFLNYLACPEVFSLVMGPKHVATPSKSIIFEKMKKHIQGFTQGQSVENFSQIAQFLESPACPKASASFWG